MLTDRELQRRRPVWEALSWFFLDTELTHENRVKLAQTITDSGYTPAQIRVILWEELFPVVASNLHDRTGVWEGFDLDWLQAQILSGSRRPSWTTRLVRRLPFTAAHNIDQEWEQLLPYLPERFRSQKDEG